MFGFFSTFDVRVIVRVDVSTVTKVNDHDLYAFRRDLTILSSVLLSVCVGLLHHSTPYKSCWFSIGD